MFLTISNYSRLYRFDVALISFLSYLVGSQLAKSLDLKNFFLALGVSLISVNFIYSFNSWTDWKIDKINKGHRPIPSGKIKPEAAFAYSLVLLFLSIIYPFAVCRSYLTLFLFLLFPFLGLLYSLKPVRLKRYFIPAVVTTSIILVLPMVSGYFMNEVNFLKNSFFVALFIYCLAIIPIKDIEDIEGDIKHNCENWLCILGEKKLLNFSLCILSLNLLFTIIFEMDLLLKLFLFVFIISTIITILTFMLSGLNMTGLYRAIIRLALIEGVILFLLLFINGNI